MVLRLLEQRHRRPASPLEPVDGRVRLEEQAVQARRRRGRAPRRLVARGSSPLGGRVGRLLPPRAVPLEIAWARSSSEHDVEPRPAGSARAPARAGRAAARWSPRQSARRPAAASRSPARSARVASGLSELRLVAGGLLEVVAEDLVQLDQLAPALLQPAGEALVQLRPGRLSAGRRRRRRGSAGGGSGSRPRRRTAPCRAGSAAGGRARPAAASPASPPVRAPGRRRGGRPRPRPRPARAPAARPASSWSRRAASSACSVGGTTTSPSASRGHRQHLAR